MKRNIFALMFAFVFSAHAQQRAGHPSSLPGHSFSRAGVASGPRIAPHVSPPSAISVAPSYRQSYRMAPPTSGHSYGSHFGGTGGGHGRGTLTGSGRGSSLGSPFAGGRSGGTTVVHHERTRINRPGNPYIPYYNPSANSQNNNNNSNNNGGNVQQGIVPFPQSSYVPQKPVAIAGSPSPSDAPSGKRRILSNKTINESTLSLSEKKDSGSVASVPSRPRRMRRETHPANLLAKPPDLDDDEDSAQGANDSEEIREIGSPIEKSSVKKIKAGISSGAAEAGGAMVLHPQLLALYRASEEGDRDAIKESFRLGPRDKSSQWKEAYLWGLEGVMEKLNQMLPEEKKGRVLDSDLVLPERWVLADPDTILLTAAVEWAGKRIHFGAIVHVEEPRYSYVELLMGS